MALFSKDSKTRRSLALAGGGVRLAYHAGVLQALEEAGLTFNHVDGTSGGIFGTAMMASGISPTDAAARWRKLKLRGFMGIVPLDTFEPGKIGNGAEGIRKAIYPALGIDIGAINRNGSFDATFNVCNFSKKTVESISHEEATVDHLIAGMSLPMFMPAIKIGDDWYTDAVWIKDCNLLECVRRGAEEIWLIWCIGNTPSYHKGYFFEYVHMIEISANAGVFLELEAIKAENQSRLAAGKMPINVNIIKPEFPLPLDPDFFFKKIDADTLINMGYADTRAYLQAPMAFSFEDLPSATAMSEALYCFTFRQQFKGIAGWKGAQQQIRINLALFIYKTGEGYELRVSGGITCGDGQVTSGFNSLLVKHRPGMLTASFSVRQGADTAQVAVTMRMTTALDLLLGLDIQDAAVIITQHGKDQSYTFYQPINNRINNAGHAAIIGTGKPWERWKEKWQTLQWLLQ